MWNIIKSVVRRSTPSKFKSFLLTEPGDEFATKVYSQEGEDLLLKRIFEHSPSGFYLDVGAHHPFRFSNTKLLYDKGWTGINIEPNPDVRELFNKYRPNDINLSLGISDEAGELTYYKFKHPALNSFDLEFVNSKNENPIESVQIKVQTLTEILDAHLPENKAIELLTIDIEGLDFKVLNSLNWDKYRPHWVLVEEHASTIEKVMQSDIYQLLNEKGYTLTSKLWNSCLFKKFTN